MLSLVISVLESPINAPAKTKPPTLTEASQSGEETSLRIALLGYRSAPFSGGQGIYLHYLSSAEAYDPRTNTWTAIAPMNIHP